MQQILSCTTLKDPGSSLIFKLKAKTLSNLEHLWYYTHVVLFFGLKRIWSYKDFEDLFILSILALFALHVKYLSSNLYQTLTDCFSQYYLGKVW